MNPSPHSHILAKFSAPLPGIDLAGDNLPSDIQWMPPGAHTIHASQSGRGVTCCVNVTAATAQFVQKKFAELKARADAGLEDRPFFDINHNDAEASAHPTEFFWAGSDPKSGG